MKIEVGKTYKNRNGCKITIVGKGDAEYKGHTYPFIDQGGINYTAEGIFYVGHTSDEDLIEEVVTEEKTKLKIEVGKTYKNRNGCKITIVGKGDTEHKGHTYPFIDQEGVSYTEEGAYEVGKRWGNDLIEEVVTEEKKIEVGKNYRRRDGLTVKIVERDDSETFAGNVYPFRGNYGHSYTEEGILHAGSALAEDLIEEVVTEEETAQNYNEGKPRPSLILRDMQKSFYELLKVREYGCIKYDRLNFKLSIGKPEQEKFLKDNLDSIQRHLLEVEADNLVDEESECMHYAQIAVRCMFALEYLIGGEK